MGSVFMLAIQRFLIFKLATDLNSIGNFTSVEIAKVINFGGLKLDQLLISVIGIGSLNQPLQVDKSL
jgi:hypothetical protein